MHHAPLYHAHLDAIEDLVGHFNALVSHPHQFHLELLADETGNKVEGKEQDHGPHTSQHRGPHGQPQECDGQYDLQWGRPDHVTVGHELDEALGIHRHEVDNLSDCGVFTSATADLKSLCYAWWRERER